MTVIRLAALSLLLACGACARTLPVAQIAAAPKAETAAPHAKNVILFIGDGMGVSTVTAARIYDGQSQGETGEENLLSFEHFPNVALVKTYNTNQQVPDSAGTATAMNSGTKTRAGVIGIGPAAHRGDCAESLANHLPLIAEELADRGKAIGIVTTTRITHATPAAVYAHTPERDWEADSDIPSDQRVAGCSDIAAQLVAFPFDVAMGGGSREFFGADHGGKRLDAAADLTAGWKEATGGHYVTSAAGLGAVPRDGKPVLGLFSPSHMTYMLDRSSGTSEPTLSVMTAEAIDRLSSEKNGYFLMVEGGRIDHGHHDGKAAYALSETQEFARAVKVAMDKVDPADTLVMVTADHSHVMTIAGYATRGNPILGLVMNNDERGDPTGTPALAADGFSYTTLGYQNGPGAVRGARSAPPTDPKAAQQSLVPTGDIFNGTLNLAETHGGEDVALYATGPGAEGVHGVIEQNRIHEIMLGAIGAAPATSSD
ncbi:alkaline phosphatase [Croceicoccus bisphenolivorans]|uniref:alkaline phosphatase n=1 Tax=Croceicoccus bisphenolivorans TaxID=1783232 RepID=UPI00082D0FCD|nr:alkaline phosphatase [Croceicoccus bisphenolivorans]